MNADFTCPNCKFDLDQVRTPQGILWECPSCKGRAATIATLRKTFSPEAVNLIWNTAQASTPSNSARECPACGTPMVEIPLELGTTPPTALTLDTCKHCHTTWFDPAEFDKIPPIPQKNTPPPPPKVRDLLQQLPPEKQERFLSHALENAAEGVGDDLDTSRRRRSRGPTGLFPEVEIQTPTTLPKHHPYAAYTFGLASLLVPVIAYFLGDTYREWLPAYAFLPSDPFRNHFHTLLTSLFIHRSFSHFLLNAIFYTLAAPHVENHFGPWRFLLILLASHLLGLAFYTLAYPESTTPFIGTTAAISGLLMAFVLSTPDLKVNLRFHTNGAHVSRRIAPSSLRISSGGLALIAYWIAAHLTLSYHIHHPNHRLALSHILQRPPLSLSGVALLGGLVAGFLAALFLKPPK